MDSKLVWAGGPTAGREEFLRGDVIVMGRGSTCQIIVPDDQVSRQHAELRRQGDQWYVHDIESVNGTFVNNRRLGPAESVLLSPGARLRLGTRSEFTFETVYDTVGSTYTGEPVYVEAPTQRRASWPVIILAIVAATALVAAAFFVWRALSGGGTGTSSQVTKTSGATEAPAAPAATSTVPSVIVQQPPTALPAVSTLPTIALPTIKPPEVKVGAQSGQKVQVTPAPNIRLEQMPGMIATAFPNVPAMELPAAIQGAIQSGQVRPEMAQSFINALFPGVPPAQLPTALAGSFAGFSPEQVQGILNAIYPGQNLQVPQIRSGDGAVAYAAWEDGNRPNIYLLNADGSGKRLLIAEASEPAFSRDGKQLAYYSWRDDALGLRIRNMDTGEDRTLTTSQDDYWPSWSPDGNRLAFYTAENNLQIINADGTDRRGIGQGEFPAWSPQSDRIAFKGCIGSNCGIVLVNPDGSNPVRITTNANDGQPAWSPDGRNIAFVSNRDGNWEIYAVNADGSWLRRITNDIHTDGLPDWAADGMRIAFRSDRTGTWAIYTVSGVGGPPIKLIDAPVTDAWDVERIAWR